MHITNRATNKGKKPSKICESAKNSGKIMNLRNRLKRQTKAEAKLGDMSRAKLYPKCLPGWLNMRATSEQHFRSRRDKKCFYCLPET